MTAVSAATHAGTDFHLVIFEYIFTCRVTVEGYKEIRTGARIFQFGPPSILDTSTSLAEAKLGADVKLTCDSFAIPLPEKVERDDE